MGLAFVMFGLRLPGASQASPQHFAAHPARALRPSDVATMLRTTPPPDGIGFKLKLPVTTMP